MRDADQSTFDVVATVPAATLRCTMPSRNTACVARWKIPMNTIAPAAARGDCPLRIGHAHDAFCALDRARRRLQPRAQPCRARPARRR
ncbi:hypothetical protein [Burkholderia seminalis]|uniref:hypothetical protein n=1 Tax=Burkholderia seminalis TaxID=488731 RepID=UPI00159F3371